MFAKLTHVFYWAEEIKRISLVVSARGRYWRVNVAVVFHVLCYISGFLSNKEELVVFVSPSSLLTTTSSQWL